MNANYIYEVFETTRENKAPDLTIGMAMYKAEHPEVKIDHEEGKAIREFMGRHYNVLTKAFVEGPEAFEKAVAVCEERDSNV